MTAIDHLDMRQIESKNASERRQAARGTRPGTFGPGLPTPDLEKSRSTAGGGFVSSPRDAYRRFAILNAALASVRAHFAVYIGHPQACMYK